MATKINLQQLAKTVARKNKISLKDAEAFLKEFFDSIVQNVTTDKLVKIKGLGTFKLIEVLDRESVHVNTGERFIIPGHTKLSFTPEAALRDLINKPFADFQTVVINDGTSLEEMERLPEEEETPIIPADEEAEPEEAEAEPEEEEAEPEEAEADVAEAEPAKEEAKPAEEEEKEEEANTVPVQKPELHDAPRPVLYGPPPVKYGARSLAKIVAGTAGVLLLCLACFFAGRYLTQRQAEVAPVQVEPQAVEPVEPAAPPVEEVQYAQVPGGEYKIVGTRKTHVMKPGEYLSKIAIEEYGDKEFTKYIIVHNDFPDPDNVPVDMEIKLPELEEVK